MSVPNEADFAVVKIGDGATPEAFTAICGIEDVSLNKTANTTDRARRDCAKPGLPAIRRSKTNSTQLDITASGGVDKANVAAFDKALGIAKNYEIELYQVDGTDTGLLCGVLTGSFNMTSDNQTYAANGDSTGEISLANDGPWVWTPA